MSRLSLMMAKLIRTWGLVDKATDQITYINVHFTKDQIRTAKRKGEKLQRLVIHG